MLCKGSLLFSLVTVFFIFSSFLFSITLGGSESDFPTFQTPPISGEFGEGIRNEYDVLVSLGTKRFLAESPDGEAPLNSSLILAAKRTYRKDPLNNFKRYTGGWNISERHYWASVAFTAAPFFVVALIWFVIFALCLLFICVCYCCCRREPYGYSRIAYAFSLILLIFFTIAAVVGCIILYIGQGKFHSSTVNTLDYVVHQANTTANSLRNVSGYLAAAKLIAVDQVLLPGSVQTDIDRIQTKINSSANTLSTKTEDNKDDIAGLVESVRLALIVLSAIMLLLTFLGFVLSIFGMQLFVYIVTADSCVAMNQWVQHPLAHTALDDILPCVDNATAQETLTKSKEVTSQLVDVVNRVITNVSNNNFPPNVGPLYYNQSGPKLPILCNPFNSDLTNRSCSAGEVDLNNATKVWKNYVCQVSPSGICATTGRLTPIIYGQMAAAVNVSFGLYHYGPFLVDLEDCDFVRKTFGDIYNIYCPGLQRYSRWVYIGLVMVGVAVLLSLTFWVIYGRERRHRVYTKEHMPKPAEGYGGNKPIYE